MDCCLVLLMPYTCVCLILHVHSFGLLIFPWISPATQRNGFLFLPWFGCVRNDIYYTNRNVLSIRMLTKLGEKWVVVKFCQTFDNLISVCARIFMRIATYSQMHTRTKLIIDRFCMLTYYDERKRIRHSSYPYQY